MRKSRAARSSTSNDVVALNDGSYAHADVVVFRAPFHSDHFARRADKDLRAVGNFRGERQRNVNFGPRLKILGDNKVKAARGNVPRLSFLRVRRARTSRSVASYGVPSSNPASTRAAAHAFETAPPSPHLP
jgi:hypothetical protein